MSQANVQLSIESEASDAVKGIAKLTKAEKDLETAVKVGNRTLKGRLDTEAGLATVIGKVDAIERRAATAHQRRAAASLAAQKSRALQGQMQLKEASAASLARQKSAALEKRAIDAQRRATEALSRAQAEQDKRSRLAAHGQETMRKASALAVSTEFRRSQRQAAEMAKAQETSRGGMMGSTRSALAYAGALVGIGSAAAVAATALRVFTAAHDHKMQLAEKSDTAATGLLGFTGLQAPGEEGRAHVQETVTKGARAGLTPEQVGTIAAATQSIADKDGNRKLEGDEKIQFDDAFGAATKLGQLGVSAEDIQNITTSAMVRGELGSVAADKTVVAAGASKLIEGDFAKSAPAMQQWQDPDAALAAVAAMSRTEAKGELPTLTRAAALALGESGDSSEFSEKFGLAGLSEAEKLAKLREYGAQHGKGETAEERIASFSRNLGEHGLEGEVKQRAVGALLREGVAFEQTLTAVRNVKPGEDLTGARIEGLKKDPATLSAMQSREAEAMTKANALYGPEADRAREAQAYALERGAELQRGGLGIGVDSTGAALPWSDHKRWIAEGIGMTTGAGMFRGEKTGGEEGLKEAMDNLQKAMDKNTAATESNSESTAKSPARVPVGGSSGNAEEKY